MADHRIQCSTGAEIATQVIAFGLSSFVGVAIRSGEITAGFNVNEADECDRIADAFRAVAAELRATKATTPPPALVAALAADEREAA